GDALEIAGKRVTVARAMRAYRDLRGQSRVQLDGITRGNAGIGLDDSVTVRKINCPRAEQITLAPTNVNPSPRDMRYIGSLLDGLPGREGDERPAALFGRRKAGFRVQKTRPQGPVVIGPPTELVVTEAQPEPERKLSYEDIGGLKPQVQRIREMIELPLRYPEV